MPYWHAGTLVFDDPSVGLVKEPFVSGIPEMINHLTTHIPDARRGFRLLFSEQPFPGYQAKFTHAREEYGGNWYQLEEPRWKGGFSPPCSSTSSRHRRRCTRRPRRWSSSTTAGVA